jgi:hypothetical protein
MLVKRAAFAAASFCIVNIGASQFRGRKVFPGVACVRDAHGRRRCLRRRLRHRDAGLAYAGGGAAESWQIRPAKTCYFFTSGHSLASSGLAASSGEIVAMVL